MNILVFKTSSDATMERLFEQLGSGSNITCLIQSSTLKRYRKRYPHVNFLDIRQEGFYDLPSEVIQTISNEKYDQVYVTFSGISGHNYGNIIQILTLLCYDAAFFYNCNGNRTEIPRENMLRDWFWHIYIRVATFILRLL